MSQQTETKAKAGAVIIPVTLFEQNCTLIWCEATKKAAVIDPGGDVPKIQAAIQQSKVRVEKIWLTHGHIDHVGGAADLRDALSRIRSAVEASGFHSELWSYAVHRDRVVPIRYGTGSDVQLWSTTDLAVEYALARLSRR